MMVAKSSLRSSAAPPRHRIAGFVADSPEVIVKPQLAAHQLTGSAFMP